MSPIGLYLAVAGGRGEGGASRGVEYVTFIEREKPQSYFEQSEKWIPFGLHATNSILRMNTIFVHYLSCFFTLSFMFHVSVLLFLLFMLSRLVALSCKYYLQRIIF